MITVHFSNDTLTIKGISKKEVKMLSDFLIYSFNNTYKDNFDSQQQIDLIDVLTDEIPKQI